MAEKQTPMAYRKVWEEIRDAMAEKHELSKAQDDFNAREVKRLLLIEAFRNYLLSCYSEQVRIELGTEWQPLDGLAGARLIAMEDFNLLPEDGEGLDAKALAWLLHRKLHKLTLPAHAAEACRGDLQESGLYPMLEPHLPDGDR